MKLIYAPEPIETLEGPICFLAGGTPRSKDIKSWRPEAVEIFKQLNFNGTLLLPEPRDGNFSHEYEDQIEWEELGLSMADCVLFWIPRSFPDMPCLTTNTEFGRLMDSGKIALGVPDFAVKCKYQIYYAKKLNIPFSNDLTETIKNSITMANVFYKNR